ncbi:MAG: MaoC family dehydratase N-terminal domain-containing protein, partial [Pseudomonadales bacterium]|nr:MaoC family dehydratase N-terminal domain-containing protein [Pseudomonadales bacterium]
MAITLEEVEAALSQESVEVEGSYRDKDSLLYAVAVGMGRDPLDEKELPYVCESVGNSVLPTAATVLAKTDRTAEKPAPTAGQMMIAKMNLALMLHGEQRLQIHQPIPQKAKTLVSNRVTGVYDKGEGKGALVVTESDVSLEDGTPL